jgi:acyl transferase domain-containing protein
MYVEAMGSGSPVSDGVELSALSHVLLPRPSPLLLGSGKGNWGHSEAAAGILSVIRAALILHHRLIPPTLHFHALPPHLPIPSDQLHVVTTNTPLPSFEGHGDTDGPVVGVSALGLGGSDAHVVLQAAPAAGHEPFLGDELDTHSHNVSQRSRYIQLINTPI